MPGIAGLITNKPRAQAERELAQMLAAMHREPFYESGTWVHEQAGVYVAWTERGGEGRAAMPQVSETGELVLVFCGEEFPDRGTVQGLKERGHSIGPGHGAHLVHAAEEDASFPGRLTGQFHGLLVDCRTGTATLFNDRFAARRVYYHEAKDGFYFAAEAKALLAVLPQLRALDERGLGEYLACGCVLEDRSLFKGVNILPWGAAWKFRRGELAEKDSYYSPRAWEEQPAMGGEDYFTELRDVFARRLPRYFNSADSIGFSLTGGLDTRMILAWHKPAPHTLPCYTFGGAYRESRDVRIARRVAHMCGQSHQVIAVGQDFLKDFARYAERTVYVTDGATSVLHAPDLYVNEVARQIAPVRLTGNYGDEVLRQRLAFRPTAPPGVFQQELMPGVAEAVRTFAQAFDGAALTNAAHRQISWFFYGLSALENSQVEMRSPYIDHQLVALLYRAPAYFGLEDVRVKMIREGNPALAKIRTDLGFAGKGGAMGSAVSRLWNRATMRAEYACEHGDPQVVTTIDRTVLRRRLERTFVGIHKFTHFSLWYRNELAEYVRAMLLDPKTLSRPYLQANQVRTIVDRHVNGIENHTPAIHKILTLEYIHRLLVDIV